MHGKSPPFGGLFYETKITAWLNRSALAWATFAANCYVLNTQPDWQLTRDNNHGPFPSPTG